MPTTSFGSTVSFTPAGATTAVVATEVRSIDVSGQSISMIDTTKLATARALQVSGSLQNTTITITCLDQPAWVLGVVGELEVQYGPAAVSPAPSTATFYRSCVLTSGPNGSATIDAAVEFTYTFEQIDSGLA